MKNGLIQVYTGDGKGKTTSAVGQIIRASGHNAKICFIQLFKPQKFFGEQKVLFKLKNVDYFSFCDTHPKFNKKISPKQVKIECDKLLNFIKKVFSMNKYDILVLDEFNIALRDKFINTEEIINILKNKPDNLEIIITGRNAPEKLIKIADLVTEMKKIKHPFDNGIKSRKYIDY